MKNIERRKKIMGSIKLQNMIKDLIMICTTCVMLFSMKYVDVVVVKVIISLCLSILVSTIVIMRLFYEKNDKSLRTEEDTQDSNSCNEVNMLTRGDICKGIAISSDFDAISMLKMKEITKMIDYLHEMIPGTIKKKEKDIDVESYTLSSRARNCYSSCIRLIIRQEHGPALHELHDFIYQYGEHLDENLSYGEYVMLYELIKLFRSNSSHYPLKNTIHLSLLKQMIEEKTEDIIKDTEMSSKRKLIELGVISSLVYGIHSEVKDNSLDVDCETLDAIWNLKDKADTYIPKLYNEMVND